jgi:DNA-binding LytR/AlgR family response regulator
MQRRLGFDDHVFLMINNKFQFIIVNTIIKITSTGNYSELQTTSKLKGLVLKSLKEWEASLPDNLFVRIHRNAIINPDFVEHVEE